MIDIPRSKSDGGRVRLNSGKRYLNLRAPPTLHAHEGSAAAGVNKLPRGFQKVDGVESINEPCASICINFDKPGERT